MYAQTYFPMMTTINYIGVNVPSNCMQIHFPGRRPFQWCAGWSLPHNESHLQHAEECDKAFGEKLRKVLENTDSWKSGKSGMYL